MAKVKFQPLGDRVLVQPIKENEQVKGGIIIPDSAKEKPQHGKIIALGTGKTIMLFSAALFVVTALGFTAKKSALLSVAAVVPFLFSIPEARQTPGKIYSTESAYQYIEVFDIGFYRYLVYNNAAGFQTVANKRHPLTGLNYYYDYYCRLVLLLRLTITTSTTTAATS